MSSSNKPVFGYWGLRGLGHPIKLVLAYLDIDYEDKRYSLDGAGLQEWGKDKFNLDLDFPNLPYWKEVRGGSITESRAVLKTIAREKGSGVLMPKDSLSLKEAEVIENVLWDVWNYLIRRCFHDDDHFKNDLQNNAPQKLEQLNKFLGRKKWLLGDKISYVDFILYEVLYHYNTYDSNFLKPYQNLLKLTVSFEALPQIQEYMASPAYISGPCFHPMFAKHKI